MRKKVLVTGGGGYIGSHMVWVLLEKGFDVCVWDNFSTGYREPLEEMAGREDLAGELSFVEIDLLDRERVLKVFEKDFVGVFHFAACCLVDESMRNPAKYFENNLVGTVNLLEAMKSVDCEKLIFSSTCAVYGDGQYFPVDEKHPTTPTNPYGESKLMAEEIIEWYRRLFGLNYAVLRYFNVCGAQKDGVIGDSKKPSVLLLQNAVRGALGIDDFYLTCPQVDTPDGTPIRDYIDVLDLCEAHLKAFEWLESELASGNKGVNGRFNLGNAKGVSVREIVGVVKEVLGVDFAVNDSPANKRQGEYAKIYADNRLAVETLGWAPKRSIRESVVALKKWYERKAGGWER